MACRSIVASVMIAALWQATSQAAVPDSLTGPLPKPLSQVFAQAPSDTTTPATLPYHPTLVLPVVQASPLALPGLPSWPSSTLLPAMQTPLVVNDRRPWTWCAPYVDHTVRPLMDRSWAVLPDGGLVQWSGTTLQYEAPAITVGTP